MKRVKNRKKMCIVPNCMRRSIFGNELSFHSFPRPGASLVEISTKFGIKEKVDRHLEWLKRLRISNHRPDMFVCSQHFAPADYYLPHIPVKTRVLKSTAVPSRNLPESSIEPEVSTTLEEQNLQRMDRRCRQQKQNLKNNKKITEILDDDRIHVSGTFTLFANPLFAKLPYKMTDFEDRLLPLHKGCIFGQSGELKEALPQRSNRVFVTETLNSQVERNIFITSLIQSDGALTSMCGIQSHAVLDEIITLMMKCYLDSEPFFLSVNERIILTMLKLRSNMTFAALALIFKCPDVLACRRIFIDTLTKLSNIVHSVLQWPLNRGIHQNVPQRFQGETMVVALDYLEIKLEKPNCSECQTKMWSIEKSDFTAKFMVGVASTGFFIFVSDIYGGKISETDLFKQSDVINRLNDGDAILVNDNFEIEAICKKRGVKLFRIRNHEIQLSRQESVFNRKLATARINLDRIKRSIREFAILRHRISKVLIPCFQDIVSVCCAFVNFSSSVLPSRDIT